MNSIKRNYLSDHIKAVVVPVVLVILAAIGIIIIISLFYYIIRYHKKYKDRRRLPEMSTQYSKVPQYDLPSTAKQTLDDFGIASRDQLSTIAYQSKPIFLENIPRRIPKLLANDDKADILLKEFESVPMTMTKVGN